MPFDINDFAVVAPLLALAAGALVVLLLDLLLPAAAARPWWFVAAVAAVAVALGYAAQLWPGADAARSAFGGTLLADRYALVLGSIALVAALVSLVLSLGRSETDASGYLALVLWAAMGMWVLTAAMNLMTIFLGLELLSLALYVAVAFVPGDMRAREAALKYFILGSTAAGFLLFGFAFLYGATGTTDLVALGTFVGQAAALPLYYKIGLGMALVGFAFKLALVPFHVWAPDVYQGAPTPITAFMSVGTKAAAFAAMARFLMHAIPGTNAGAYLLPLVVLAILSMFVGSLAALVQGSMKRILAYSGIAHAGYLMMALPGLQQRGVDNGVVYLVAYLFMTMGAFAVILYLDHLGEDGDAVAGYRGLFYRRPALAAGMAVFLFALAGLPPTGGFTGKFLLAVAAVQAGAWSLLIALILTTGISAFVYLRIVVLMIRRPETGTVPVGAPLAATAGTGTGAPTGAPPGAPSDEAAANGLPPALIRRAALAMVALALVGTLQMGLWPGWVVTVTRQLLGTG